MKIKKKNTGPHHFVILRVIFVCMYIAHWNKTLSIKYTHIAFGETDNKPITDKQQYLALSSIHLSIFWHKNKASWTYFPQGLLNIPQILHWALNQRTHIIPLTHLTMLQDTVSTVKPHYNVKSYYFSREDFRSVKYPKSVWNVVNSLQYCCGAPNELHCLDETYSKANWSRNIPTNVREHYPVYQSEWNLATPIQNLLHD